MMLEKPTVNVQRSDDICWLLRFIATVLAVWDVCNAVRLFPASSANFLLNFGNFLQHKETVSFETGIHVMYKYCIVYKQ